MTLFEQFQTIIGSIVFGFVFLLNWTFFNRLFYSKKLFLIRIPLEIALFCLFAFLYYIFISEYGYGLFNIFYLLSLALGCYLYYRFYAGYFETFFESIINWFYKLFIRPLKLKIKKLCAKLKIRKKYEKTKSKNK